MHSLKRLRRLGSPSGNGRSSAKNTENEQKGRFHSEISRKAIWPCSCRRETRLQDHGQPSIVSFTCLCFEFPKTFPVSFPHYFLSATGHVAEQLKTREW